MYRRNVLRHITSVASPKQAKIKQHNIHTFPINVLSVVSTRLMG